MAQGIRGRKDRVCMWLACKTSNDAMPFCNKQGESQVPFKPSLVKDQNSSLWRRRISPSRGDEGGQIKIYMFLSFGSACPSKISPIETWPIYRHQENACERSGLPLVRAIAHSTSLPCRISSEWKQRWSLWLM